jgi:hypothetical protein
MPDAPLALEVRSVTAFGLIVAPNSVSFTLRRGEIHARLDITGRQEHAREDARRRRLSRSGRDPVDGRLSH